jgi:hypothetical protein
VLRKLQVLSWQALALGHERLELAVGFGSEGLEYRGCPLAVCLLPHADWIRFSLLAFGRYVDTVDPCTIEAEDLGF